MNECIGPPLNVSKWRNTAWERGFKYAAQLIKMVWDTGQGTKIRGHKIITSSQQKFNERRNEHHPSSYSCDNFSHENIDALLVKRRSI